MNDPNWTDQLVAWCALATAVITLVVGVVAIVQLGLIRTQIRQAGEAQTAGANERARAAAAEQRRLEASVQPHLP
ncbi:MAG: hypothetical protein WD557_01360 [Dehalococcoidia bacterium]